MSGGGYEMTSDREAEGIALKFMAMGYSGCSIKIFGKTGSLSNSIVTVSSNC